MLVCDEYFHGAGKFADSGVGMITFGTVSGGAGAALTGGNFWQGAVTGLVVSGLNHAMHEINNDDFEYDQKGKKVTRESLGIKKGDTGEQIIDKILKGMKIGDYADGDLFSFFNDEAGDYIKSVERVGKSAFQIKTKGITTGLALKDNSTISITTEKIPVVETQKSTVYKIRINGLTSLGKNKIYQEVYINSNNRYMHEKGWIRIKIK